MATHSDASQCRKQISSFAKTLTVRVATYLAKEIASLFRPVLYHPLMSLTDEDTLPLLTSEFWIRPVYEELLHCYTLPRGLIFHLTLSSRGPRRTW